MKLADYKKIHHPGAIQATLVFLRRDDEILLAMKKRGFGMGKWNGPGGKVEPGETIEEAARREVQEEIGVEVDDLEEVANLSFYFMPDHNGKTQNVACRVYICRQWMGEPEESEEMAPQWYNLVDIPYAQMWEDDQYWLPSVLSGQRVDGEFLFEDDLMHDMILSA